MSNVKSLKKTLDHQQKICLKLIFLKRNLFFRVKKTQMIIKKTIGIKLLIIKMKKIKEIKTISFEDFRIELEKG